MSYGLQTFDASGNLVFDSTTYSGIYHKRAVSYLDYTPVAGESATTVTTTDALIIGKSDYLTHTLHVPACALSSGAVAAPDERFLTWSEYGTYPAPTVSALGSVVDSYAPASVGEYGFVGYNDVGGISISSENLQMCRSSDMTATVSSIATDDVLGNMDQFQTPNASSTQPTTTLPFPKPLAKPPLIFIKGTQGVPISLFGFIKTGGLYTAAKVTASLMNGGSYGCPVVEQSCTVTYFIVSDELIPTAGAYGIQVFTSAGVESFNSSLSPARFTSASSLTSQYMSLSGYQMNQSWSSPSYTFAKPYSDGMLLNPFTGITGAFTIMVANTPGSSDFLGVVVAYGDCLAVSGPIATYSSEPIVTLASRLGPFWNMAVYPASRTLAFVTAT